MGLTVLQVLPALNSGGVERGTVQVAHGLVDAGHRALVVSAGGRLVDELCAGGAEHVALPVGAKNLTSITSIKPLRRLMEHNDVDIVHARSRLPAWVTLGALRGLRKTPRFLTTVHGPYSVNRYSAIMARRQHVIAVSEFIKDYILENYRGVDPENIKVIPRGIDPNRFHFRFSAQEQWRDSFYKEHPALRNKTILSYPGRLTRWKGQTEFLQLLARLDTTGTDVHGLLIGGAHARKRAFQEELEAMITHLGLTDRVTLLGDRTDVREILSISDAAFSLTLEPEAFGRTTLEALALGTPVIGYEHGGTREILKALYPRGLVNVGEIDQAVERTKALLASGARIDIDGHPFTEANMVRSTLAVYAGAVP